MGARHRRSKVGGHAVETISNGEVVLSSAPELGGRIVSLRGRAGGREWLDGWMPAARRRIWHPSDPADFASGPGAGIDECFPTVLPCRHEGRNIPDHGDLWNTPVCFDEEEAARGVLSCAWLPASLPLAFGRKIRLAGNRVLLDYRLENLADKAVPFLWAWHPLFAWKRGDEIRFAPSVATCLEGDGGSLPWPETAPGTNLSRAVFASGTVPAAKVFVGPLRCGQAEIRTRAGARLSIEWPAELFPYAGIWISRGFWKGLHHWAIEPTNAPVDRLSDLDGKPRSACWSLGSREVRTWRMTVKLDRW